MQSHQPQRIADALIAAAVERALGSSPSHVAHLQTKGIRSVYEAILSNGSEVILKAEDDAATEEHRLGLEARAIEQARAAEVPAPAVLGQDLSLTAFPFRYFVMEKASGVPLDIAGLAPEQQRAALRASGRLLARLHRVRVAGYGTLDEQHYIDSGEVMGRFARWAVPSSLRGEAALNALYGDGVLDVDEAAGAMHLIEAEAANDEPESRLLHGDFSARHTLIDPASGAITAIIDYGDRMGGPPAWDLAGAWLWDAYLPGLVEDAIASVIQGHDAESGSTTPKPRLIACYLMRLVILARTYHEQGRVADFEVVRLRLRDLLEEAGRL